MPRRGLIVARIKAGAEDDVARVFARSDRGELPTLAGVRHRSLFVFGDVYLHLVEFAGDAHESVEDVRHHELFQEVSRQLEPYIAPYDPATWAGPADALAREIYSWDAPETAP